MLLQQLLPQWAAIIGSGVYMGVSYHLLKWILISGYKAQQDSMSSPKELMIREVIEILIFWCTFMLTPIFVF